MNKKGEGMEDNESIVILGISLDGDKIATDEASELLDQAIDEDRFEAIFVEIFGEAFRSAFVMEVTEKKDGD